MVLKSLDTDRLLLREIQASDWKLLAESAAIRMIDDAFLHHDTRPLARIYVDQALAERTRIPRRRFELAIVLKETRRVIGACSLKLARSVLVEADLGYILQPAYWNQGYGTEAATRLLELAFRDLGVFRITAHCEPSNEASIRILRKLGLGLTGKTETRLEFARLRPVDLNQREPVAQAANRNF